MGGRVGGGGGRREIVCVCVVWPVMYEGGPINTAAEHLKPASFSRQASPPPSTPAIAARNFATICSALIMARVYTSGYTRTAIAEVAVERRARYRNGA